MEVTSEDKIIWKDKIKGILFFIDDFCKKHNIKYYCCGGTAIGVARHKGFIPWDDDIDIAMPRPDYMKFIECFNAENPKGFEFISYYNTDNFYYGMAKVCLTDTTLIEFKGQPYIEGLYVDIFPLDGSAPTQAEFVKTMDKYRKLALMLEAASTPLDIINRMKLAKNGYLYCLRCLPYYAIKPILNRKKIIAKMEEICLKYKYEQSEYVSSYCGSYNYKERFPQKWIGNGQNMIFENMDVVMMDDYDSFLRHYYGDYLKLPPKDKQIGHHFAYYYNLYGRKSLSEIKGE